MNSFLQSKGIDNVAFQEDNEDRSILISNKNNPPSKSIDQEDDTSVCTKCQVCNNSYHDLCFDYIWMNLGTDHGQLTFIPKVFWHEIKN